MKGQNVIRDTLVTMTVVYQLRLAAALVELAAYTAFFIVAWKVALCVGGIHFAANLRAAAVQRAG